MDRKGIPAAKTICENPKTDVERIFNGFLVAGSQFITIISRVPHDSFGTFLLPQSYIILYNIFIIGHASGLVHITSYWYAK